MKRKDGLSFAGFILKPYSENKKQQTNKKPFFVLDNIEVEDFRKL